jgi:hypothetical protein
MPGPCARATCASGVCLAAPDDALCSGGTCGSDYRCATGHVDGGPPADAGADASAPPSDAWTAPTFVLRRLPRGGASWSVVATAGDAPTDPIEAAFAMPGTDEIMVLTHTELFVLRVSSRTFVERRPRDPIFPELAGIEIRTAVGVNGTIYVTAHDTWLYGWDDAARSATFMQMIRHEDLGADWHGPLTPPWFAEYASFYAPDNADAWASVDPMQLCGPTVGNYIAYLSWDGFGPAAMITTVWDAGCFQFVDRSVYGASDYLPFTLPGAPPDPFSITAVEWYEGLWVFSTS